MSATWQPIHEYYRSKKYKHLVVQWVHKAREDLAFDMHVLMFDAMYCMHAWLG
jgi:hypothetical protein